jgi:hypothetical protein
MGLGPPKGGKPHRCQPGLQRAQVSATKGKVMQKVSGTLPVIRVGLIYACLGTGQAIDHVGPDSHKFFQDCIDLWASRATAVGGILICHEQFLRGPIAVPIGHLQGGVSHRDSPFNRMKNR